MLGIKRPRQRGNHTTERNTAEMRGCHGEEERRKKNPRTVSCASASLERSKDFPVASEGKSVKDAVPGQQDGNDPGEGRENATKGKEKEVKTVLRSTPCGYCWQWCPSGPSQCTKFHLARRRESLGGQRMADATFQPLPGWGSLVLDGTECLQDCRSSRSYRKTGIAMKAGTPELQRKKTQNKGRVENRRR